MKREDRVDITEHTRVPIKIVAFVLGLLATLLPGTFWLSAVIANLTTDMANAKVEIKDIRISILKQAQVESERHETYINTVHQIDLKLARMENRGVKPKGARDE